MATPISTAIYEKAWKADYSSKQGLRFAIAGAQVMPQCQFRIERETSPAAAGRIIDLELASCLSGSSGAPR
jgi:hypothetical protein